MTPLEAKIEELKPKYTKKETDSYLGAVHEVFDAEGFGKEIARWTYKTVKPTSQDYLATGHNAIDQITINATQAGITEE